MMIDAARPLPFQPQGKGLARGLEAIDPPQGMLIAYASAPGTVAPDRPGDYGAYATAIAEMLRAPGTDLETAFTHIRSRTHLTTEGQQTPWHVSALGESIELVPPEAATASVPPPPPIRQARPMRDIGPDEAYALAIEMDTLEGYTGFVQAYPGHPYTQRVWAMIRARREALAWMRALEINTPQSYWTYLRRYPNGMYALRRRTPPAPPRVAVRAAAGLRDDGVRRRADGAGRRAAGIRGCLSGRAATAARPLWRAASGLSREPAAAAARGGGGPGSRILPALAVGIPLMAALAPAPRRALPPDAPGRRRAASDRAEGIRTASRLRCLPAVAPNTVTPPPGAMPSPGNNRPPGWGPAPGGQRPPGAAGRHRAALRPTTLPLRRARRAKSCCSTCSGQRDAIAGRSAAGQVGRLRGDCQPDAAGGSSARTAAPSSNAERGRPAPRHSLRSAPASARWWSAPGIANRTPPAGPPSQSAAPPARPQGPPAQANRPPPQRARRLGRRDRRRR